MNQPPSPIVWTAEDDARAAARSGFFRAYECGDTAGADAAFSDLTALYAGNATSAASDLVEGVLMHVVRPTVTPNLTAPAGRGGVR
jgi:hypothetical protein